MHLGQPKPLVMQRKSFHSTTAAVVPLRNRGYPKENLKTFR